jgi:stearoyl-CoA desaturase (delta-9 desaturase)
MSTVISHARSGAGALWQAPRRSAKPSNWLKCAPFIGLHLACLAVFLTGVDATALVLCGATYFLRMFGITAGYHRYFAHRAYKTSRLGQFVLACAGWTATTGSPAWSWPCCAG